MWMNRNLYRFMDKIHMKYMNYMCIYRCTLGCKRVSLVIICGCVYHIQWDTKAKLLQLQMSTGVIRVVHQGMH